MCCSAAGLQCIWSGAGCRLTPGLGWAGTGQVTGCGRDTGGWWGHGTWAHTPCTISTTAIMFLVGYQQDILHSIFKDTLVTLYWSWSISTRWVVLRLWVGVKWCTRNQSVPAPGSRVSTLHPHMPGHSQQPQHYNSKTQAGVQQFCFHFL